MIQAKRAKMREMEEITVSINGLQYHVPTTFSEVTVADYLRMHVHLTGTKVMCREGGCGACTVMATFPDPAGSGEIINKSINACMCLILSCDGWEITTVEGLGDQNEPHVIQKTLAEHYGTQCGYCTPGMIMRMHSLINENPHGTVTKKMVEDSFGGNLCRCTGYRPILDAFKSLVGDNGMVDGNGMDIEDVGNNICHKTGKKCSNTCQINPDEFVRPLPAAVANNAPKWYKPGSLTELYAMIPSLDEQNPYYVVGHTGIGVFNDGPYYVYVDVKGIAELYAINRSANVLSIGANIPLTDVINLFMEECNEPGFAHLQPAAENIARTAHPSLRNLGSWGGNMAMKNRHKDFPSDSFISFIMSGARIIVGPGNESYSMEDFVENLDLLREGKFIVRAEFPRFGDDYIMRGYKIMPRNSNAHALVNAGFRAKIQKGRAGAFVISEKPVIVFGNITEEFMHAHKTEEFLIGKDIGSEEVLQQALRVLSREIEPTVVPAEATPAYKKSLSLSLFYKFALEIVGRSADDRYRSAVGYLERGISSGTQSYQTKKELWPLTQPILKSEALVQCTGEAAYISDIDQDGMLHAAFVLTTQGNATIARINIEKAMALPGVLRVFTASDIPGQNNMNQPGLPGEDFLADGQIKYACQPVAFVVAVTRDIAEKGAKLVEIDYANVADAIVTCEDAIRAKSFFQPIPDIVRGDAVAAIKGAANKISGELDLGSQAHFYMEQQVSVAFPVEDGINIEAGTQHIDATQVAVASCLGISKNRVNVTVRRNGGGFGGKASRNNFLAVATSMAAQLLKRPVKMHFTIWDNMKMVGKRFSYYVKYQAGFDNNGRVQGIFLELYRNTGAFQNMFTEMPLEMVIEFIENAYWSPAWKVGLYSCKTHTPPNTWTRAPGSTESIYFLETVMEHIAHVMKKSPIEIKMVNFLKDGQDMLDGSKMSNCTMTKITRNLLESASYDERVAQVNEFNQYNRWRKRGLGIVPMRYAVQWNPFSFSCMISVYHNGGSVAVTHGGIELGQGLNTKIAQVVAHQLGIGLENILILPTTSVSSANNFPTAANITTEMVAVAAISCCDELKRRMAPVRASQPKAAWRDLVEQCFFQAIDLSVRGWGAPRTKDAAAYNTYGATCVEVELDVLTGEYQMNRCDVLYDVGESWSPLIDVGQVEGGLIMGLGYYTSEEIIFDQTTGEQLTIGTWKYKPPTSKDIPVDLRVTLLPNAPNPIGILRSKCVGEPPLCMGSSVVFALRNAITAARKETRQDEPWFRMDAPITVERAQQYCATDISEFRYSD